jgi:hypothetical protein
MTTQLGTPRGRYDEHSSKFSLSKKLRFIDPVGKKLNLRRWCLLASRQLQTIYNTPRPGFALHQQQRGTCTQHNQVLCSQLTMRLSISPVCYKQRYERIEWKTVVVCEKVNNASNSKMVQQCKGNWTGVHSSLVASFHKINNNMLGKQNTVGQLIE